MFKNITAVLLFHVTMLFVSTVIIATKSEKIGFAIAIASVISMIAYMIYYEMRY